MSRLKIKNTLIYYLRRKVKVLTVKLLYSQQIINEFEKLVYFVNFKFTDLRESANKLFTFSLYTGRKFRESRIIGNI